MEGNGCALRGKRKRVSSLLSDCFKNTEEGWYFITCKVLSVCFLSPEIFTPETACTWYSLHVCHLHMALHLGENTLLVC